MKFRTISRLIYLKKAQHRRGHGIHSPFLFRLITSVIEDNRKLPEYKFFKELKNNALGLLKDFSDLSFAKVYLPSKSSAYKRRKLFKKVELRLRYGRVVFRLIRYFKPSAIFNYGPTLGVNLFIMALADSDIPVYQVIDDQSCRLFSEELLKNTAISNIHFLHEKSMLSDNSDLIMINYPYHPDLTRDIVQKSMNGHFENDILIVRGIHESKEIEDIWQELIESDQVRVSLDLFEMGIALFRPGLQKENFILRF